MKRDAEQMDVPQPSRLPCLKELHERLALDEPQGTTALGQYLWPLAFVGGGWLATLVAKYVENPAWALALATTGLAVELSALVLIVIRRSRDVVPAFRDAEIGFIQDVNEGLIRYRETARWLQQFEPEARKFALEYLSDRSVVFRRRHATLFGPLESLGLLPIVVALLIQLFTITTTLKLGWWGIALGLFLLTVYAVGLWMMQFTFYLEAYARALKLAQET